MVLVVWLLACAGGPEASDVPVASAPVERGVRMVDGPAGPVLEVASDRYRHPRGGEILVQGSAHVADPAFFAVSVARLAEMDVVMHEGLIDDVEPLPSGPGSTAHVLGLQHQGEVDVDRPGWSRRDLAESDLQDRMRADGVDDSDIRELLVDQPGTSRADLPDTPRGVALARLRYMRDLAVDETGPTFQRYLVRLRDDHLVAGIDPAVSTGVWFGAAHLPGIGEGLASAGWVHEERVWTPAIATSYSELELGPVQVQQLVKSWE